MTFVAGFRVDDLDVRVFASAAELGTEAAHDAATAIRSAVEQRGRANVMFASGHSQFAFLAALTSLGDVPWSTATGFHMDGYVARDDRNPPTFPPSLLTPTISVVHPPHFPYLH